MAEDTIMVLHSGHPSNSSANPLGSPVDFVRSLGRQLPRTAAPEGWVRRIDRRRVGKVWVGFFHLWTTDADGRRVRQQKEKTLGPAWMPKHEAQQKLQNQAVVQFLITDDRRVERHLTQLGYYRDARAGLSIEAVDAGGLRLRGILHDLQHGTAGTELLEAELTSADEQFASHGRCRLIDEGSDAIIRTEESALRDLKFSFAYNVSPPVRKAWNLLEPIVGRDRLRSRTKTDLWASRICRVEETTPADDDIAIVNSLTNELLCRRESGKHWHVITGAAGTGKTRLVATMAHTYLARSRPQTDQRKSRHSHRIRGMATIPELLDGHITLAVECLDRLYLNGYIGKLATGPGLVFFMRDRLGKPMPSPVVLGQISEKFREAVKALAEQEGVPVYQFRHKERKDDIANSFRRRRNVRDAIVFIGVAQEKRRPSTARRSNGRFQFDRDKTVYVNHYYFYIDDEEFGPLFLKICSYAPWSVKLCLNGHEWAKRQLDKRHISYESLDNGFLSCSEPMKLQKICDALGP